MTLTEGTKTTTQRLPVNKIPLFTGTTSFVSVNSNLYFEICFCFQNSVEEKLPFLN